jgi:hypothetical protein
VRRPVVLAAIPVLVLAMSLSLGAAPPTAHGTLPSKWCADAAPPPCVESASRNGVGITSSDPTWTVYIANITGTGSNDFQWMIWKNGGFDLGAAALGDTWVIHIDTGTEVPRVAFTHGDNVTIDRALHGDGTYHVTVTATPVVMTGDCDQSSWPWTCPMVATREWSGYLDGEISDYGSWGDATERNSIYGMNYASDVAATGLPPQVVADPATGTQQIVIDLANPHFRMDGVTVFQGFVHQRIPNAFLHTVYGIDDPATLTGSGLVAAVSGSAAGSGTITVSQEPSGDAMLVDITGLTFSARKLRIERGVITPTRPTGVSAVRTSATAGKVRFTRSSARGSRIVGYAARCAHGSSVKTAVGPSSPIVVTGLSRGVPYSCQVKARSKAGVSLWSAAVNMPAHPA